VERSDVHFSDFWSIKGITEMNNDDFLHHYLQKNVFHCQKKLKKVNGGVMADIQNGIIP
jgi:hypothetical protein